MKLKDLKKINLPDEPGVYYFYNGKDILYIGKATSLKSRVKSYFDNNILHTRGLHIANMVSLATEIKWQTTRSVLEALLLEQELIKKYLPKFNTLAKDDKSYLVLVITEEDFPRVVLARNKDIDKENNLVITRLRQGYVGQESKTYKEQVKIKKLFGPYPSGTSIKESLRLIRKIFPFRDKCIPYDKKIPWKRNPCFSYQIGLCPGVCCGVCDKKRYKRIIDRLITFLEGNSEKVRLDLEADMKEYAKEQKFEEAQKVKETLFALDHIRDAHLISRDIKEEDKNIRIEAFDVAHISGKNRVGAMTVVLGGVLAKQEYKKFKISLDKNDDLEGLKELFTRRLKHLEWGIPDIVVLDGDERHIKVVEKILKQTPSALRAPSQGKDTSSSASLGKGTLEAKQSPRSGEGVFKNIKVVAVTKDKSHKAKKITSLNNSKEMEDLINNFKKEIVLVNSEAHRFSLSYHKLLRKKSFL